MKTKEDNIIRKPSVFYVQFRIDKIPETNKNFYIGVCENFRMGTSNKFIENKIYVLDRSGFARLSNSKYLTRLKQGSTIGILVNYYRKTLSFIIDNVLYPDIFNIDMKKLYPVIIGSYCKTISLSLDKNLPWFLKE